MPIAAVSSYGTDFCEILYGVFTKICGERSSVVDVRQK